MADKKAERIVEFIKPLRVKPGSKVNLGKDFDPGYTAGWKKKDTRGPQVVRAHLRRRDPRAHPDRDRSALPGGERGKAEATADRQA
jgi:hypothetical protein